MGRAEAVAVVGAPSQHEGRSPSPFAPVEKAQSPRMNSTGGLTPPSKTRGFHTQLDEGPETPRVTREASGVPFLTLFSSPCNAVNLSE